MLAASSPAPRALASQSAAGPGSCCAGPLWGGRGRVPSHSACLLWGSRAQSLRLSALGMGRVPSRCAFLGPSPEGGTPPGAPVAVSTPPLRRLVPLLPSPRHTRSTSHAQIIRLKCLYLNTGNQQRKSTKANTGSWKRSMKLTSLWAELTKKKRGKTQITIIGNEK